MDFHNWICNQGFNVICTAIAVPWIFGFCRNGHVSLHKKRHTIINRVCLRFQKNIQTIPPLVWNHLLSASGLLRIRCSRFEYQRFTDVKQGSTASLKLHFTMVQIGRFNYSSIYKDAKSAGRGDWKIGKMNKYFLKMNKNEQKKQD
jgi:hypothetical protein